ncbi:hypothetical protein [Paenibacillus sp. FSL H8-0122]|uniref:hypothetical protein n=1 Tax=Paenibacillus sp. FSL H8-0122 TaxID=2954510 RepID=UPI0040468FE9
MPIKYSSLLGVNYYKLKGGVNDGTEMYGNDDEHVYGRHDVEDEEHENVHGNHDPNGHDEHGYGQDDDSNAAVRRNDDHVYDHDA